MKTEDEFEPGDDYEDDDWEEYEDDEYSSCSCPYCFCSNVTPYGVVCDDCWHGAHQG